MGGNTPNQDLNFAAKIVNGSILESIRTVIYHFDINNEMSTESYLYKDHFDKKNNPDHIQVAVFSTMI